MNMNTRIFVVWEVASLQLNYNWIRVYHAIVTSLFLYASPAYGRLHITLLAKLERFQKRAHRRICGPSCECDGFSSLSQKFDEAAVRLLRAAENSRGHLLQHLVPERLPMSNQLRLPFCSTVRRLNSFIPWASHLTNAQSWLVLLLFLPIQITPSLTHSRLLSTHFKDNHRQQSSTALHHSLLKPLYSARVWGEPGPAPKVMQWPPPQPLP